MDKTSKARIWCPVALNAVLLIAWCAFIFSMSSANGGTSQGYSDGFSFRFLSAVCPGFSDMGQAEQLDIISSLSFPVRKAAHMSEYLVLALLAGNLLRLIAGTRGSAEQGSANVEGDAQLDARQENAQLDTRQENVPQPGTARKKSAPTPARPVLFVAAWVFCVVFACTDEFHQLFVDGRSAQIFDVCVDAVGALLGAALLFAFCRLPFMK